MSSMSISGEAAAQSASALARRALPTRLLSPARFGHAGREASGLIIGNMRRSTSTSGDRAPPDGIWSMPAPPLLAPVPPGLLPPPAAADEKGHVDSRRQSRWRNVIDCREKKKSQNKVNWNSATMEWCVSATGHMTITQCVEWTSNRHQHQEHKKSNVISGSWVLLEVELGSSLLEIGYTVSLGLFNIYAGGEKVTNEFRLTLI